MSMYKIIYSRGGTTGLVEANSALEAIEKDCVNSGVKARFFETFPKIEPNHFVVTNLENNSVKYYKMVSL